MHYLFYKACSYHEYHKENKVRSSDRETIFPQDPTAFFAFHFKHKDREREKKHKSNFSLPPHLIPFSVLRKWWNQHGPEYRALQKAHFAGSEDFGSSNGPSDDDRFVMAGYYAH